MRVKIARNPGVTLVELMMVVALMGLVALMARTGLKIANDAANQQSLSVTSQQAQTALYGIVRDVRNARRIVSISSDTLVLEMFDNRLGYGSDSLFDPTTFGTATYSYQTDATGGCVRRVLTFPSHSDQRDMLKNLIIPPTSTDFIFQAYDGGALASNIVNIALRVKPPVGNSAVHDYQALAMCRTRTN
jgi:prepilin-type N-terminal cleavage/methylation domain-containing protein